VSTTRALPEVSPLQVGSADRAVIAFTPRPDGITKFAGPEGSGARRPRSSGAEMLVRRRHAHHRRTRDAVLHNLARRVWYQRFRLAIFAANGMNVFAAGLLIQVLLVRYVGMGHIPSYIAQTIASVQMSFFLSRFLTWGDRDVAILPALIRFNMQQLVVTGLGMAGYAGLEQLGMNYIVANVAVTAMLTPVSFLSSHKWSLMAPSRR
jgi:putative flippase GtrA